MVGTESNPGNGPAMSMSPETLALAAAMAVRGAKRREIEDSITTELYGAPPAQQSEDARKAAFMVDIEVAVIKIENPTKPITLDIFDQLSRNNSGSTFTAIVHKNDDATPEEAAAMHTEAREFARELKVAHTMAAEFNIPVANIYNDDDFYIELCRRSATIDGVVTQAELEIQAASPEALEAVMRATPMASRATEFMLWSIATEQSGKSCEIARQTALYKIARLWGGEGMANLTDEQRAILQPKLPIFSGTLALLEAAE